MSHKANPVQYGWTYQGSNEQSRVAFYERDGVKMDHYPTTGQQTQGSTAQSRNQLGIRSFSSACSPRLFHSACTVKTSMEHPTQGHTQMFRRGLGNEQFQAVLENPRTHTGQGYQTKASKYYTGK